MPRFSSLFGNLRNPWRYPEFMEYGLAGAGLLQSLIAWSVIDELPHRHALAWTIIISPEFWASIGISLCLMHILGLWLVNRQHGYVVRRAAGHASLVFWLHFVGTIGLMSIVDERASGPTLLAAAMVAPYSAFVVCVRLWKEWQ